MNEHFYIAYTAQQDRNRAAFTERTNPDPNPGYYAGVLRVGSNENLCSLLASIGGLKFANIYPTKKKAAEIAQFWNDGYKANGTYFFG